MASYFTYRGFYVASAVLFCADQAKIQTTILFLPPVALALALKGLPFCILKNLSPSQIIVGIESLRMLAGRFGFRLLSYVDRLFTLAIFRYLCDHFILWVL